VNWISLLQAFVSLMFVLVVGWLVARQRPRSDGQWTYGYYQGIVRWTIVLVAMVLVGAFCFNGLGIFKEAWWVIVTMFAMAGGTLWLLYDVFCTRLKWNEKQVELEHLPLREKTMRLDSINEIRFNRLIQTLTLIDDRETRISFSYTYRVGINDLLVKIDQAKRARQVTQGHQSLSFAPNRMAVV
jgi:hypothetical protein